jgi:F420-dependent oxidoreductase-like protein
VRLGLNLRYFGVEAPVTEQLELVREAERLGFDSVWAAEGYGSDAATVLGWVAAHTSTIRLGSAIFQIPARSAGMTAMTAATLDHLSGGRFILGLGTSGPQVSEGWHGVRFGRQLQRTREYVDVVRAMLRGERIDYHGKTLELPLRDGPGKALKLTIAPLQERIPVYLAAIGRRNVALAAEIADGWLPVFVSPERMGAFESSLHEGFARAGRTANGFDVAPTVSLRIDDDLDAARDVMRRYVALYVGGMGSREQNFYNRLVASYGFEDAARQVQDLFLAGRKEESMAALPGELIDAVTLCGPADRVRDRLGAFRAAGVGTLILSPIARTLTGRVAQLRAVADLAG